MKKQEAQQKWWETLSDWLENQHGRADYLFAYDPKRGQLDRCFDRNVALKTVDATTVSDLYRAAAEGRLGLLQADGLKPQLLTADPENLFVTGKENLSVGGRVAMTTEKEAVSPKQQAAPEGESAQEKASEQEEQKTEQSAVDAAVFARLHAAEELYRQVVYAPSKPKEEARDGEPLEKRKAEREAVLEHAVDAVRNAVSLQLDDGFQREQEQLIASLAQMMMDIKDWKDRDEERLRKKREAEEELVAAQNMFVWAAFVDKYEREQHEARMEMLLQMDRSLETGEQEIKWWQRMGEMTRKLHKLDLDGADEELCKEKIRDYLDGKITPEDTENEPQEEQDEMSPISAEMWGNTLRHFCRFAASEVPLSVRHVKVAEHCRKILKQAKEKGISIDQMGLDAQDQAVLKGTMELGVLVERGLFAQAMLSSGQKLSGAQRRECLRNYLAMKGVEETLIPHVETHQEAINSGDGPVSALQILMGHEKFHAKDLQAKAGKTAVFSHLDRMDPQQVSRMITHGGAELSAMGRQVMMACCQMDVVPQNEPKPVAEPQAPQVGGPIL